MSESTGSHFSREGDTLVVLTIMSEIIPWNRFIKHFAKSYSEKDWNVKQRSKVFVHEKI